MALGDSFLAGSQLATQQALDDARRQEIQQKALAAYGGVQGQGLVNRIALTAPVVTPDAGYVPQDQGATQRMGQAIAPPTPPPAPVEMPAQPPTTTQPQYAEPDLPPPPPPRLDEQNLRLFRQGLAQRLGQYGPLTRQFFGARGLTEQDVYSLAGLGPVAPELEQKLLQLGEAELPDFATGTETPDFKLNQLLMQQEGREDVAKLRGGGRGATPDDFKTTLQSFDKAIATASGQYGGILQPQEVERTKKEKQAFMSGVMGFETPLETPGEQVAYQLGARFKGAGTAQAPSAPARRNAAPAAGAPKNATMQDINARINFPRMPGILKKTVADLINAGTTLDEILALSDIQPYIKARK